MKRALLLLVFLFAGALHAQQPIVQTGISRDTIRVGDPFRAVLRIQLPAGTQAVLPDSLPATDDVENSGKMRMRHDTAAGSNVIIAAYPLTAWRPGQLPLPDLSVLLKTGNTERTVAIKLPDVSVISVLPADTSKIQAKPPKDVWGGNRLWWPWLLLLLAILIALGLLYWWWRRRRGNRVEEVPVLIVMPRERALEELARIRKLGLIEESAYKRFYTLASDVLRQYMATVEASWSTHLTTDEVSRKVRGRQDVAPAIAILRNSDMVKFAKHTPDSAAALRDFDRMEEWIRAYPAPMADAAEGQAA